MNPFARRWKALLRSRREGRELARAGVAIVSYPKSGRTWLRVMLGKALCDAYDLPEARLLDTEWLSSAAGLPRTIFSHDGASHLEARPLERLARDKRAYRGKKVLLLVRDPRDVVVSGYYQASRRRRLFEGTLSAFLRDPRHGLHKVLTWYALWERNLEVPAEVRVLRYESLQREPEAGLASALELLGARVDGAGVARAVEFARFDNMRRMEEERRFASGRLRPGASGAPEAFKVRRGVVGGYRDELTPEDVAWCRAAIDELGCPAFVALTPERDPR